MPSAAPTTSTQLDRQKIGAALVGKWVRYVGSVGSVQGQQFQVTAAYPSDAKKGPAAGDTRLTLSRVDGSPALSFVRLTHVEEVTA